MKQFRPEVVQTVDDKPVMGFVIPQADLPELERQIHTFSKGQHLLAIKEEGDKLRIALFLYNPNPPPEMLQGIQAAVEQVVQDKSSIQRYGQLENYEPSSLTFGKP